jgi:hypothetical protein
LLPVAHTLTGCDYTSKVGTNHAALNANPSEYLNDFDCGPNCTDEFVASCETYLVQVLKQNITCTISDQLRDYIIVKECPWISFPQQAIQCYSTSIKPTMQLIRWWSC